MTLVNAKSFVMGTDVWWLGCVMTSNENLMEVTISFLQSHGPSPSDICMLNSQTYLAFLCQKF